MKKRVIVTALATGALLVSAAAPASAAGHEPGTIVDVAVAASGGGAPDSNPYDYDLLVQAVLYTGLEGVLGDPNASFTVFAPNDQAFLTLVTDLTGVAPATEAEALVPGGWLVAQCGGGPNIARLRERADALMATPPFAAAFARWPGPWTFADAETTAQRLRAAGFVAVVVHTWLYAAFLEDPMTWALLAVGVVLARRPRSRREASGEPLGAEPAGGDPESLEPLPRRP